jgi:hypothetical protein
MNYLTVPIRTVLIPTDTYVAGTVIDNAQSFNQLDVLVAWVKGSATSCEVKVETAPFGAADSTATYYQETNGTTSGATTTLVLGEYTFTTAGNYTIKVPISARFVKVSVKGTGTLTTATVGMVGVLHTV